MSKAKNKINYGPFSENLNPIINRYRSSHDAAKIILKLPNLPKRYHEVAHFLLKRKNFLMPKMKIKKDILNFRFKGQKVVAKYLKGSVYSINGEKIDFSAYNLHQTSSSILDSLFFEELHAIAWMPIYFGIIVVGVILGGSCIAQASGRSNNSGAKWIRNVNPTQLDRALNNILNEVKQLCGAANASSGNEYYQFSTVFEQYCRSLGRSAISLYESRSSNSRRNDGPVNPQVFRFAAQRPHELAPNGSLKAHLEDSQVRLCHDEGCQNLQRQSVNFTALAPSFQESLLEIESPTFNRECIEWGLQLEAGLQGPNHQESPPPIETPSES